MSIENLNDAVKGSDTGNSENTEQTTATWIEGLNDEYKTNTSLNKFPDVNSLVKSYVEMEKLNGSRISIPSDDASDEDIAKFYNKLGRPEDKNYFDDKDKAAFKDILNDETVKSYQDIFHKHGLTKAQGKALVNEFVNSSKGNQEEYNKLLEQEMQENFDVLSKKYGDKIDEKIKLVEVAISKHGSEELSDLVEATNYHPALVDLLITLGSGNVSDNLVTGKTQQTITDKENAKKELKKLESDKDFMLQYNDRDNPANETAIKRMKELYELAYND